MKILLELSQEQEFQSTPSVWRETFVSRLVYQVGIIFQSTPSVWRETFRHDSLDVFISDFNPLPPCGGRLQALQ